MSKVHEIVPEKILAELEAGDPPWIQRWSEYSPGLGIPQNVASHRPYSGVNVVLLWAVCKANRWDLPVFLTYKQAGQLGGHVRKGEHSHLVVFTKEYQAGTDNNGDPELVRVLKWYTVFHISQCDDLPDSLVRPVLNRGFRDVEIGEFLKLINVEISESASVPECFYHRGTDRITMLPFASFKAPGHYYSTLFHELLHWCGHPSRLNRARRPKELPDRAIEELIAELGSAMLCAEFGIDGYFGHAHYIKNWADAMKADTRLIIRCASKAQEAVDYLRDLVLVAPAVPEVA
jgi:antirestriction protein ArdC